MTGRLGVGVRSLYLWEILKSPAGAAWREIRFGQGGRGSGIPERYVPAHPTPAQPYYPVGLRVESHSSIRGVGEARMASPRILLASPLCGLPLHESISNPAGYESEKVDGRALAPVVWPRGRTANHARRDPRVHRMKTPPLLHGFARARRGGARNGGNITDSGIVW